MDLEWILNPLTMYGGLLVCLFFLLSMRLEMGDLRKRYLDERAQTKAEVEKLSAKVAELAAALEERPALPVPALPATPRTMNINQRAEALRMSRRGHETHTIAAALGLPAAEVTLLQTVQTMLEKDERQN
jgi:hypothetical protein